MKKSIYSFSILGLSLLFFFASCSKEDFGNEESLETAATNLNPTVKMADLLKDVPVANSITAQNLEKSTLNDSYKEYNGKVITKVPNRTYDYTSPCVVRVYSNDRVFISVPRRYDFLKKAYVPSPKAGDIGIVDTDYWSQTASNSTSVSWRINKILDASGSVWMATTLGTNLMFNFQTATTMKLEVLNRRAIFTIKGTAKGTYTNSVTTTIEIL